MRRRFGFLLVDGHSGWRHLSDACADASSVARHNQRAASRVREIVSMLDVPSSGEVFLVLRARRSGRLARQLWHAGAHVSADVSSRIRWRVSDAADGDDDTERRVGLDNDDR